MVERPWTDPLPPAHPVPYGRPRQPDGDRVPHRPRPPVRASWYERVRVIAVLAVAVLAVVIGALR